MSDDKKTTEEYNVFEDIGELSEIDLSDDEIAQDTETSFDPNNMNELKADLKYYEKNIVGHIACLLSHQDDLAYVSRDALELRAHIRDKKKDVLSEFKDARIYEKNKKFFYKTHKNKTEIKKGLQDTRKKLKICFQEYQEALSELQDKCEGFPETLTEFQGVLEKLQQKTKEVPSDYSLFVAEHMQALLYATSDLFHNTSRHDISKGMKALWQSIKKVCACLFNMSDLLQKEQELLQNSEHAFNAVEVSEQENIQMMDNDIEGLFKGLEGLRELEAQEPRVVKHVERAVERMQTIINNIFSEAKEKKITLTPVQHAALQELRAEARRAVAGVTPGLADKARERFTAIQEDFKGWVKKRSGASDEPEQDNSKGNRP